MHKSKLYLIFLLVLFIVPQMAYAQDIANDTSVKHAQQAQTTGGSALSGTAALMDAVAKGLIKKADREDIKQYIVDKAKAQGLPDDIIEKYLIVGSHTRERTYVLLSSDFVIPYGLADVAYDCRGFSWPNIRHHAEIELIVPADMPEPKGPRGFCQIVGYDQIEPFDKTKEPLTESCKFPNLSVPLPSNAKIYVLGTDGDDQTPKLEVQIDANKEDSLLKEIIVNSPAEPVILLLHGSEPNIWHFSWTNGTKIAAVYVSGDYNQTLSGLPKDIPVFNNNTVNGNPPCPIFSLRTSLKDTVWYNVNQKGLVWHNNLSKHLFNRNFDYLEDTNSGKVIVGEPLAKNIKLKSAERLDVDKFRIAVQAEPDKLDLRVPIKDKPHSDDAASRAVVLRDALAKGLIRKATDEDRRQYIVTKAKAEGLSEDTINNIILRDAYGVSRYCKASYVILSEDFFSAYGPYGGQADDSFIVPEGLNTPPKRSNDTLYGYDRRKEVRNKQNPGAESCKFTNVPSDWPPKGKVYALSDRLGSELDFQIEGSAKPAKLVDVKINSPSEPVFLLLSARNPAIWHFSWTKGTKIAGVYISSHHNQIVSGLPADVPLLINNQEEQLSTCPPLEISYDYDKLVADNNLSRRLFKRNIDKMYLPRNKNGFDGVIGQLLANDSQFESAEKLDLNKYRAPGTLLTGQAGLNEAVEKGLIREATDGDIKAYKIAEAKAQGVPDNLINNNLDMKEVFNRKSYLILSPDFIIPVDVGRVAFFVPEGMPEPKGPCKAPSHRSSAYRIYRYDDLSNQASKQSIAETCKFPNAPIDLPANAKVYAIGRPVPGYLGSRLDFYIDDHNMNLPYLMKITVNSPSEPVILMLETIDSTIWHFNWTKGTKIAAVYIAGYGRQVTSGLPSDVPVLIDKRSTNKNEPSLCPGFSVWKYASGLGAANNLSQHLFKRDIFRMHALSAKEFVVGQPLEAGSQLESAEELQPEKFRDSKVPLPGQVGLEEAISKGLIRKASSEEVQKYLEARAKAEGLPDHIIKNGFSTSGYAIHHNPYIVLSSDFIIPEHSYGNNSASFIVPLALAAPKRSGPSTGGAPFLMPERQIGSGGRITEIVASRVYNYKNLKHMGKDYFSKSNACVFTKASDLPVKAKVYAVNGDAGTGLDFTIEGSLTPQPV